MTLTKLVDWTKRLAGVRSALDDLHRTDKELRQEHERLTAEHARIRGAFLPRAELLALLGQEVDELGRGWRQRQASATLAAGKPSEIAVAPGTALMLALGGILDMVALCGLVPDAVKAGLSATVREASFEEGPPAADRPRLLTELEARISGLEEEHTELVDHAAELGIRLELLEPVRSRRAAEAVQRERAAREESDRERDRRLRGRS